jgi:hypothetical protein
MPTPEVSPRRNDGKFLILNAYWIDATPFFSRYIALSLLFGGLMACATGLANSQSRESMKGTDVGICRIGNQYFECTKKLQRPLHAIASLRYYTAVEPVSLTLAEYQTAALPAEILSQGMNLIREQVNQYWPSGTVTSSNIGPCTFGFKNGASRAEGGVDPKNPGSYEWLIYSEAFYSFKSGPDTCNFEANGAPTGRISITSNQPVCPSGFSEMGTNGFSSSGAAECIRPIDSCSSRAGVGNPISFSGLKTEQSVDYQSPNALLNVARFYDSSMRRGSAGSTTSVRGAWAWSFESRLFAFPDSMMALRPGGERLAFPGPVSSTPVHAINRPSVTVQSQGNGWLLVDGDRMETFDGEGALLAIWSASGRNVTYVRQPDGIVSEIRDDTGRSIKVSYQTFSDHVPPAGYQMPVSQLALVSGLELPDGKKIEYGRNSFSNEIETVTRGGELVSGYVYNYYSNGRILLDQKLDGGNAVVSSFGYTTSTGHATTTRAGGLYDFIETYTLTGQLSPNQLSIKVTDPRQIDSTVAYTLNGGVARMVSQSQPAGFGCSASARSMAYDVDGNTTSVLDFNGNRSCMGYFSARGLQAWRVDGLPASSICTDLGATGTQIPADARRVETQWHPDLALTAKVAEPGRITTIVYNGQSDPFDGNAVALCAPVTPEFDTKRQNRAVFAHSRQLNQ